MNTTPLIIVCRDGGCADAPWLLWLALGLGVVALATVVWMTIGICRNWNKYQ